MADWNDGSPSRPLNAEEAASRQRYLGVHPGQEGVLPPFTNGYAPIADWVAAGSLPAGQCRCYVCVPG